MPGEEKPVVEVVYCPEGYDEYCINDDGIPCPFYLDGVCSKEEGILRDAVKPEECK